MANRDSFRNLLEAVIDFLNDDDSVNTLPEVEAFRARAIDLEANHTVAVAEFEEWSSDVVTHVAMRASLVDQAQNDNLPFAWEMAARYFAADEEAKADIEAFYEPMLDEELTPAEYVGQLRAKDEHDIPTSIDLKNDATWTCSKCGKATSNEPGGDERYVICDACLGER